MPVVEFSAEQCLRVDEIYEAVWEMCRVFTEDPDLEAKMEYLGPIADYAAETLVQHGYDVRFPTIVYDEEADEEYVAEYY